MGRDGVSKPLEKEHGWPTVNKENRRWPEALGSATSVWFTGPGNARKTAGEAASGERPLASASNEVTCLLEPVVALAGLLLTEESLDLRHPLCLAPAVPALNTAEDEEPSEKQEACDTPQHGGQELWRGLGERCGQNLDLGFQQDFAIVTQ